MSGPPTVREAHEVWAGLGDQCDQCSWAVGGLAFFAGVGQVVSGGQYAMTWPKCALLKARCRGGAGYVRQGGPVCFAAASLRMNKIHCPS